MFLYIIRGGWDFDEKTSKDYDKNTSTITDDQTTNREGETESVYKEEGTTSPTVLSRTGSSSPIQAMRSKTL